MPHLVTQSIRAAIPKTPEPAGPSAFCLRDVLAERAALSPDTAVLLAPGRQPPMNCRQLLAQSEGVVAALNGWGLGRGDRIATFVAPGPEAAALMFGVASG